MAKMASGHVAGGVREPRCFHVKYAGLIPEIRNDIDPSGRTDLLKVMDVAETLGQITILGSADDFVEDAILQISLDGVKMTSLNGKEELLVAPVKMVASVGLVTEEALNIVPLKIGLNREIYDLAVIYVRTSDLALSICNYMSSCFQAVYQESIARLGEKRSADGRLLNSFAENVTSGNLQSGGFVGSLSTSTSASSRRDEEINEYITMISVCLSKSELNDFAILMTRWRQGEIPIQEFGQKLLEIYGPERKHLLARMKPLLRGISAEDLDQLNKFLLVNGITENAAGSATSPLMTAEMSLTTEEGSFGLDNISCSSGLFSPSQPK